MIKNEHLLRKRAETFTDLINIFVKLIEGGERKLK